MTPLPASSQRKSRPTEDTQRQSSVSETASMWILCLPADHRWQLSMAFPEGCHSKSARVYDSKSLLARPSSANLGLNRALAFLSECSPIHHTLLPIPVLKLSV